MKALLGLAVTLGLFGFASGGDPAPKPKDGEKKDPIKAFEGEWKFASWTQSGNEFPKEFLDQAKWTVKGDKYTFTTGEQSEEGTIKLDADKKPATIDLDITAGMDKGKKQLGIYKVEKDSITVCLGLPGGTERPTEFEGNGEKGGILIVFKRKDD